MRKLFSAHPPATHFVRLCLNLDDMLPQLFVVINTRQGFKKLGLLLAEVEKCWV